MTERLVIATDTRSSFAGIALVPSDGPWGSKREAGHIGNPSFFGQAEFLHEVRGCEIVAWCPGQALPLALSRALW